MRTSYLSNGRFESHTSFRINAFESSIYLSRDIQTLAVRFSDVFALSLSLPFSTSAIFNAPIINSQILMFYNDEERGIKFVQPFEIKSTSFEYRVGFGEDRGVESVFSTGLFLGNESLYAYVGDELRNKYRDYLLNAFEIGGIKRFGKNVAVKFSLKDERKVSSSQDRSSREHNVSVSGMMVFTR